MCIAVYTFLLTYSLGEKSFDLFFLLTDKYLVHIMCVCIFIYVYIYYIYIARFFNPRGWCYSYKVFSKPLLYDDLMFRYITLMRYISPSLSISNNIIIYITCQIVFSSYCQWQHVFPRLCLPIHSVQNNCKKTFPSRHESLITIIYIYKDNCLFYVSIHLLYVYIIYTYILCFIGCCLHFCHVLLHL